MGRPAKITTAISEAILEFINDQPQSPYLDEIQLFLQTEFDVDVKPSSICKHLKKIKWTHKKGQRIHEDRDDSARASYRARICVYHASQLVVLDETGCNTRTGDRRWGWAPSGIAYRISQTKQKGKNWSILPAMGINGYLDYEIYQGSFDAVRFFNFVRRVMNKMTPYPGPRSVLILDNCNTHHTSELEALCKANGVRLEYLPAYSPDFSPIEESFSVVKSWIRKNRALIATDPRYKDEYWRFLEIAIQSSDLKGEARNLFRSCHYTVHDEDIDIDYSGFAVPN